MCRCKEKVTGGYLWTTFCLILHRMSKKKKKKKWNWAFSSWRWCCVVRPHASCEDGCNPTVTSFQTLDLDCPFRIKPQSCSGDSSGAALLAVPLLHPVTSAREGKCRSRQSESTSARPGFPLVWFSLKLLTVSCHVASDWSGGRKCFNPAGLQDQGTGVLIQNVQNETGS